MRHGQQCCTAPEGEQNGPDRLFSQRHPLLPRREFKQALLKSTGPRSFTNLSTSWRLSRVAAPAERHPSRNTAPRPAAAGAQAGPSAHWPTNGAPAACGDRAERGRGDWGKLTHAITRVWAEEKDIGQDDAVRACLRSGSGSGRQRVAQAPGPAANLGEAVAQGVLARRSIVGDQKFWGQDRLGLICTSGP